MPITARTSVPIGQVMLAPEQDPPKCDTQLEGQAFAERLHPDHRALLELLPENLFDLNDLITTRALLKSFTEPASANLRADVEVVDFNIDTRDGESIVVRQYRRVSTPPTGSAARAAIVWIHGGGYVMGDIGMNDPLCADWAADLGIAVYSVEYRLAPENPYPIPLNDCEDAARWVATHHDSLGIDPQRIAIGGSSAGGGLAASLVVRLCSSESDFRPAFQLLVYPMLDDRGLTPSSQRILDTRVWNVHSNQLGWAAYLGELAGRHDIPADAAPGRYTASDLKGLPPTYIPVGDQDLFVDEDSAYAAALRDAGTSVDLHVFAGAFHASNLLAPANDLSIHWANEERSALRRWLDTG